MCVVLVVCTVGLRVKIKSILMRQCECYIIELYVSCALKYAN